jgi:OmpR-family two-component system manganese-sensing sensor histidine kinase
MFQRTRLRLALWYAAITAVLLVLFATGVYFYVRNTLIDRIDDTLKHVAEVVHRSLVIEDIPSEKGRYEVNVAASFPNPAVVVEDDHIDLEWFNPQGELLWSTFAEPQVIPLHFNRSAQTLRISKDRLLRQIIERVETGRYVLGYLRVSHPWFEVTKPIRQLTIDLSLGTTLMVLSSGAIGWFLSGIAIQPVKDSYQSLKQFTADASHELRNPIAMIQTTVQMALAYPNAQPQWQENQLKVVERLTQRLGNLVNDLLFLARSDSGIVEPQFQTIPLDALLMEVIEEQRLVAQQKNIFLGLKITESNLDDQGEIFNIQGDWDQLARLFTNLISNGIEYSQGASVVVDLEYFKRDRQAYLQVKVQDDGKGISEDTLPHIFDRFYRADTARHHGENVAGTGLGLAIVKAIAESHHGQITVNSSQNVGTAFIVTLPCSSSQVSLQFK